MVQTQLALATDPSRGQTAVQAARLVLAMLTTATPEGEDDVDPEAALDSMSPDQRAALRAMIGKAREEAERATEESVSSPLEPDGEGPLPPDRTESRARVYL